MYSNLAPYQKHLHTERNSDEWITGTEFMSNEQKTYLKTLSLLANEEFDEELKLSKASAKERIRILEQKIGRRI